MPSSAYETANAAFMQGVLSDDPNEFKIAQAAVTDYTRVTVREDSFLDHIMPLESVSDSQLTRQVDTDKNCIVLDRQPRSLAAASVPFDTGPVSIFLRAPRYQANFDRVQSTRYHKDIDTLRTYQMDVREIISDEITKDISDRRDAKFIAAINSILGIVGGAAANTTVTETGAVQSMSFSGGLSRDTLVEAYKLMLRTSSHLTPQKALINAVTWMDFAKQDRLEIGGDLAQKIYTDGVTQVRWLGVDWIITIKTDLVPDGHIYWFAAPQALGKNFVLSDVTMSVKREDFMLEMFCYGTFACAIGNIAGVCHSVHS